MRRHGDSLTGARVTARIIITTTKLLRTSYCTVHSLFITHSTVCTRLDGVVSGVQL